MVGKSGGTNAPATPFPAIVGQESLKQALLAVAANEALDGLLIRGEKGTAKSTAVRALVELLPEQEAVADCPYGCPPDDPARQCEECRTRDDPPVETRPVPLVTLPLGATRDRVVGTLSVSDALDGEAAFEPGLLARANRGILYVDEVNLLDDHLVDVLLDVAASGLNRVERDGVSVSHPADFVLVGTMNPEEGDLRPQLRDRFALQATVVGSRDLDDRVEIIDRALDRERDPDRFAERYDGAVGDLERQLVGARKRLGEVTLGDDWKTEIAALCRDAGVDGHRADIATARTAMTLAALDGRPKVVESDVREAAELALPHRLQSRPFEEGADLDDLLDEQFDERDDAGETDDTNAPRDDDCDQQERSSDGDGNADGQSDRREDERSEQQVDERSEQQVDERSEQQVDERSEQRDRDGGPEANSRTSRDGGGSASAAGDLMPADGTDGPEPSDDGEQDEATPLVPGEKRAPIGEGRAPDVDAVESVRDGDSEGGRGRTGSTGTRRGARVRTERATPDDPIDVPASVRAAAVRESDEIEAEDLRRTVRSGEQSALVVFAVDASASMLPAMRTAKRVVLELLKDAYRQRDEVAFVAFAGEEADVLLPPTDSVTLAARHLKDLPTGERTPLPAGLRTASRVVERADPAVSVVVLVTDGRANVADGSPTEETRRAARRLAERGVHLVVVDASEDGDRAGLTGVVAAEADGERVPLSALSAERVEQAVADGLSGEE